MSVTVSDQQAVAPIHERNPWLDVASTVGNYLRRNPALIWGMLLLLVLLAFVVVGSFMVDTKNARALSVRPLQEPSERYLLGSDKQGRDMLALMVAGTPLTLRIGLIAGFLGVSIGAIVAFVSAYYGGWLDAVTRVVVDTALTIPSLMLLIVIVVSIKTTLTPDQMALVIASLAWLTPARIIRAQVLTIRERSYVQLERARGHLQRALAEPVAVPRCLAGDGGLGRDPGLDRPRSARARLAGLPDTGDDALLGQLQRGADQRLVVVVGAADHRDRGAVHGPVPGHHRPGRVRQPAPAPRDLGPPSALTSLPWGS